MQVLRDYNDLHAWAQGPVALTAGFFDGVHRGHQHLLLRLRELAARHGAQSVVVTFSNSPRAFHQHGGEWRYITLPEEKLALLAGTGVDATLIIPYTQAVADQSARQFLAGIAAQCRLVALCLGYDTSIGCDMLRGREQFSRLAAELGLELSFVEAHAPEGAPVKSSRARELIVAGDMAAARQVLGHPYFVMGTIGAGKGKGGPLLGAPTANIYLPHEKISPPPGVYAGLAGAGERRYAAAIVVLTDEQARNTVLERDGQAHPLPGDPTQMIVETHLIGYAGDLYGAPLTVQFLSRLRDFRDFASAEELAAQIRLDIEQVKSMAEIGSRHSLDST